MLPSQVCVAVRLPCHTLKFDYIFGGNPQKNVISCRASHVVFPPIPALFRIISDSSEFARGISDKVGLWEIFIKLGLDHVP